MRWEEGKRERERESFVYFIMINLTISNMNTFLIFSTFVLRWPLAKATQYTVNSCFLETQMKGKALWRKCNNRVRCRFAQVGNADAHSFASLLLFGFDHRPMTFWLTTIGIVSFLSLYISAPWHAFIHRRVYLISFAIISSSASLPLLASFCSFLCEF